MAIEISEDSLSRMRAARGRWAAYVNMAMDSANVGHVQFLKYGEGCTFAEPPERYPADSVHGLGWRYVLVGYVDLVKGEVVGLVGPKGVSNEPKEPGEKTS